MTLRFQVDGEVVWIISSCIAERTFEIDFCLVVAEHGEMSDTAELRFHIVCVLTKELARRTIQIFF